LHNEIISFKEIPLEKLLADPKCGFVIEVLHHEPSYLLIELYYLRQRYSTGVPRYIGMTRSFHRYAEGVGGGGRSKRCEKNVRNENFVEVNVRNSYGLNDRGVGV
jgi:hypothetical protein